MKEAQPTLLPLLQLADELGKQKDIKPVLCCKPHLLEQISSSMSLSRRWAQMQSSLYSSVIRQGRKAVKRRALFSQNSENRWVTGLELRRRQMNTDWDEGSDFQLMTQILERFASELKHVPQQCWQNPGSSAWAVFEAPLRSKSFYRDTSTPLWNGHDIPEGQQG